MRFSSNVFDLLYTMELPHTAYYSKVSSASPQLMRSKAYPHAAQANAGNTREPLLSLDEYLDAIKRALRPLIHSEHCEFVFLGYSFSSQHWLKLWPWIDSNVAGTPCALLAPCVPLPRY